MMEVSRRVVSFLCLSSALYAFQDLGFCRMRADSGTEASPLSPNLSERTPSMPTAPFKGLPLTHYWCQVLPACSWDQHCSKGLRVAQPRLLRRKKIKNKCSLTCLLNKPYQNSTFMKADVSKQRLYTEWPSEKRCFDIWVEKRKERKKQYHPTSNILTL